jgi:aspartyl aminopeptidase
MLKMIFIKMYKLILIRQKKKITRTMIDHENVMGQKNFGIFSTFLGKMLKKIDITLIEFYISSIKI